jgi:hypothetical protein
MFRYFDQVLSGCYDLVGVVGSLLSALAKNLIA